MGSRIGFEFDLMYLQKGVRFKGTDTSQGQDVSFDATMNFNMISVPVLLRFNILDSPTAPALYVLGGGEIAYILETARPITRSRRPGKLRPGPRRSKRKT